MNSISINGKIVPDTQPVFMAANQGYRYGDGLFETMKLLNGKLLLESFHFDRLYAGMSLFNYTIPKLMTTEKLRQEILELAEKNRCTTLARVRLSVSRGNGGLYDGDQQLQWVIECWPLNDSVNQLNDNGLLIDIYSEARKSLDIFSNLKSANFLPYTMAAQYAKTHQLNDSLVLNTDGFIADSTIANIFIIKDRVIHTPALKEGCVNGVMRRYLLETFPSAGYEVKQVSLSAEALQHADEVFLTNAINGIRWVKQFRDAKYDHQLISEIYTRHIQTILR
jgi:branched-chain amino acid aminotransferase